MRKEQWLHVTCAVCVVATAVFGVAGGVLAYIGMMWLEDHRHK
ncbi:putative membrane protein [Rhizobium phage Palo]|uniref:Putative membrane protein n=1 Tax=Rhizobium phage Palo TaxID=2767573 RepID=A0A7L8G4S7_9CAUD|nr:putative membrane protein [Rhizobium phage Palo]